MRLVRSTAEVPCDTTGMDPAPIADGRGRCAVGGSTNGTGRTSMRVEQIMTREPACCTPDTPLREVARMMVSHDCGEIPLIEDSRQAKLVGVVTDRDIVCRLVAEGRNPVDLTASE